MTRMLRIVANALLLALLVALLAVTFAVFQRNAFDRGDIMLDLPLLGAMWLVFAIVVIASNRLSRAWGEKRELHP